MIWLLIPINMRQCTFFVGITNTLQSLDFKAIFLKNVIQSSSQKIKSLFLSLSYLGRAGTSLLLGCRSQEQGGRRAPQMKLSVYLFWYVILFCIIPHSCHIV